MMLPFAFFDSFLSPQTMVVLAIVAVLLYGERLPEVAREWGKKLVELKKSVHGIREEFATAARDVTSTIESAANTAGRSGTAEDAMREEATAPKFEPPPSEPAAESP